MTSRQQQSEFAKMLALLISHATSIGYELTLGEAWRPEWVAQEYEKRGQGKKNSFHCKRLAIDLNLFIGGKYQTGTDAYTPLGVFWESLGGSWGGRFKKPDGNHFSLGE